MKSNPISQALFMVALALMIVGPASHAANNYWTSTADGDATNAANWSGGILPAGSNDVFFTNNTGFRVDFSSTVTNRYAYFTNGAVTVNPGGNTWQLTNAQWGIAGATVTVTNGTWSSVLNSGGSTAQINPSGASSGSLIIQDGGRVILTNGTLRTAITGPNNGGVLRVSGSNSVLQVQGSDLYFAFNGVGNELVVSNGGLVQARGIYVVTNAATAVSNRVLVAGNGSKLKADVNDLIFGAGGSYNTLLVTNAGTLEANRFFILGGAGPGAFVGYTSTGNEAVVSAANLNLNSSVYIGQRGTSNSLTLRDGSWANVAQNATLVGGATPSIGGTGSYNRLVIDASTWTNAGTGGNAGDLFVGVYGMGNLVLITNGGAFITLAQKVLVGVTNNSTFGSSPMSSNNTLLVTDRGLLQANTFIVGTTEGNSISNIGGVFQFTSATPTITPNGFGRIVATNATISFKGAAVVFDVKGNWTGTQLTNMQFLGANTLRMDGASNTTVSAQDYTFNQGLGATNYVGLEMINGAPAWRGGPLTIGGQGTMLVSNANASITTVFTNKGSVKVINGILSFQSSAVFGAGAVTNVGGTYEFTSLPTFSGGGMYLTNGAISFRGITNADVRGSLGNNQLTNILFSGNNTFRLNNASNFSANSQNYTFATGNPSNYFGIEMINGGTAWKSAWLNIGAGGSLLISNTVANLYGTLTNAGNITVANASATYWSNVVLNSGIYMALAGTNTFNAGLTINGGATMTMDAFSKLTGTVTNNSALQLLSNAVYTLGPGQSGLAGNGAMTISSGGGVVFTGGTFAVGNAITNSGTINAVNANVTYGGPVVIGGRYSSDPSTNIFATNVQVTASGSLAGSNGDLFVFGGNFANQSTNRTDFSLSQAAVLFTNLTAGVTNHTYNVAGSASVNYGTGFTNFDMVSTNFGIGTFSIAAGNHLTITGSVSAVDNRTNAVYVGWLDIQGWSTNSLATPYLSVSNSLVAALSLPNINLYYSREDSRNQWLNDWIPGTGYSLWNGGLLLPIPEPGAGLLMGASVLLLAAVLRRRKG